MTQLKEILEAYRDNKREFPSYGELMALATPPVTVLTDERASIDTPEFSRALGQLIEQVVPQDHPAERTYMQARRALIAHIDQHVAREVAVQASQVAVPEGYTVERVGDTIHINRTDGKWEGRGAEITPAAALTFEFLASLAAPSPAVAAEKAV